MFTGTIQSQVKLQMLDAKWQKKKQGINEKKTQEMTQEERMLADLQEQAEAERERSATGDLYIKLQSGGTLTSDEIAYLREHNPQALSEYEKAQEEKKSYEQALKNCRTKEDVDRLKLNHLGNFAARAKSIANNSYIPKSKKLELMQQLNNEVCVIRDAHNAFVKSGAYAKLPEEAELAEEKEKENKLPTDQASEGQTEAAEETDGAGEKTDTKATDDAGPETDTKATDDAGPETDTKATDDAGWKPDTEAIKQDDTELSWEQLSQEIEQFLRKNRHSKPSFTVEV